MVALYFQGVLVRVARLDTLAAMDAAALRGRHKGEAWALTPEDAVVVVARARRVLAKRRAPAQTAATEPPAERNPGTSAPAAWSISPKNWRRPRAAKAHLDDVAEYWNTLPPEVKAYMGRFLEETVLNRWREDGGTLYPRGSEGRRKLQFAYNHRNKDILDHKEWHEATAGPVYESGGHQPDLLDRLAADFNEDALIAVIDRQNK